MARLLDKALAWVWEPQDIVLQAQLETRDARIARLERDALELEKRVFRAEMRILALIGVAKEQALDNERKG